MHYAITRPSHNCTHTLRKWCLLECSTLRTADWFNDRSSWVHRVHKLWRKFYRPVRSGRPNKKDRFVYRRVRQGDPVHRMYILYVQRYCHLCFAKIMRSKVLNETKRKYCYHSLLMTLRYVPMAVNNLYNIAQISGLEMNTDKPCIVWIGSTKHSQIRCMRDMNFCWDPGICKILRVAFSTVTEQISTINYDDKLPDIKHVLTT